MAVIISIEDWEEKQKIVRRIEDEDDLYEAKIALEEVREKGSIPFDEMKKLVGL